ncbi:MAG: peptidase S11, partial [Aeromonas sp.]
MQCRVRAVALVLGIMGILGLPAVHAAPNPATLEVRSSSALVLDANTGDTLYQKNATTVRP